MKMTIVLNEWRDMIVPLALKEGGSVSINAEVYGCWAVHIVVLDDGSREWAISHIPTGLRLTTHANAATFYDVTPTVEQLQAKYGAAWNTENANKVRMLAESCKDIWKRDEVTA